MKTLTQFFLYSLLCLLLISCKKDNDENAAALHLGLDINLKHSIDGSVLNFDTLIYQNEAGNNYGITKLNYYLSRFEFTSVTGSAISFDTIFYIDGKNPGVQLQFPTLPLGYYSNIKFIIGLDSLQNKTGYLQNTIENVNMAWPDNMGGGYHFLKLEGFFFNVQTYGYAMHLGKNRNAVPISINAPFIVANDNHSVLLEMNINEWFRNPHTYDFNTDGNYSMADSAAMAKLTKNGKDVFSLKQ